MRNHGYAIVVLSASLVTAGCSRTSADSDLPIRVDGSSTVFPVTQAAATEFVKGVPNVRFEQAFSGTTAGFTKFCADKLDIQNASRPIRPAEDQACRDAGVSYLELPIAYDGITVIVHPDNTWAGSMTVEELSRLWQPGAEGKVTKWSQVRSTWPDRELRLFGPGTASGTYDFFTEMIVGKSGASRPDYSASEDDLVIVNGVASDPLALGYVGYDHFEKHRGRLQGVSIDDGDDAVGIGPVEPTALNVRRGVYRPLSRPLFVYLNLRSLSRPDIEKFLTRYLRQADAFASSAGAIPLREPEYQLVRARFNRRQAGSAFTNADPGGANIEKVLGAAR